MQELLKDFFDRSFDKMPKRVAVAVSGGVDSMALMLAMDEFARAEGFELCALTVDHNLRQNSGSEALQLAQILREKSILHKILSVDKKNVPVANVEGRLREMRYELLYDYCVQNEIGHLFLAHHQGDVAENFLIRLFRGSGIDGLSGMGEVVDLKKIKLCRPFLGEKKVDLKKFVQDRSLVWFEDETNEDERFLRNKIRGFLASFEDAELIEGRIAKTSTVLAAEKEVIDEVTVDFAKKCLVFVGGGANQGLKSLISGKGREKVNFGDFLLNLDEYQKVPSEIALKILSLVMVETSGEVYKPRFEGLKGFEQRVLGLKKGRREDFYGCMAEIVDLEVESWSLSESSSGVGDRCGDAISRFSNLFHRGKRGKKSPVGKIVRIYRNLDHPRKATQKFDEDVVIVDGRFLIDGNGEKRFYFRTVLSNVAFT